MLLIVGHWSIIILQGAPFVVRWNFTDGTLHRISAESTLDSWSRMSGNGETQWIFTCDLHLLDVFRLHRSFAEHIQAHGNNIFTFPRFEGSRAPHSSDFYRWPHFLYTCVRLYFTGVSQMRGSVAHLSISVSCPIALRQYSWCWVLIKL